LATNAGFTSMPALPPPGEASGELEPRMPEMAIRLVPWPDMANDVPAWDALALCAAEPNPFYESWYLLPALRAFDREGDVSLVRFEAGGELAGLIPLMRPNRYYRWPLPNLTNWVHGNCFLGAPLVAAGLERAFWQAFLAWADSHAGAALFLHLGHIPLEGPLHAALTAVLEEQGRYSALVYREDRALLRSELSPAAYFEESMSGKKRKELRRQHARLCELGDLRFERQCDAGDLGQWITQFLTLEAAGWKGRSGSALACDPGTATLFRDGLHGAAARGRLERLTLSLDGQPIAMLANFLTPPGAFSFKTAFDEAFSRFSPGVLLQRENLALLAREGIAWSDSCAAADHPMIDHIWRERRPIGRISIAIGGLPRRTIFRQLARAELARKPVGR
jgi:CelD/BcsL family acetyltransferase involved in cellulose biosynthesis